MADEISTLGIEVQSNGVREAARDLQRLETTGGRAESAAKSLTRNVVSLSAALAGLGIAAMARQLVTAADEMTNISARIRLVTESNAELAMVQGELFRLSQASQTSFRANAELYTSIARATDGLGLSQQRLLSLTDGISKAMVVSGTAAAGSEAAIRQLGQALQSGALRGDEFNSLAENAPRLMKALADGLKIARGELRSWAEAGKLTTDVVLPALETGLKKVDAEFAQMPQTISRASTALGNAFDKLASDANSATGATSLIASSLDTLANNLELVANVIGVGVAAAIGRYVAAIGQSIAATATQVAANRAALASAALVQAAEVQRATVAKAAAVADLERARAAVAATQMEIAADRERIASTALVIKSEIELEKVRLAAANKALAAASINGANPFAYRVLDESISRRASAVARLADLSRQLAATTAAEAAVGGRLAAVREAQTLSTNTAAAATARLNAVQAGSAAATAAVTGAAGLARGALAALGGPIGLATTALLIGGSAWLAWRDKAVTATADVENLAGKRIEAMIEKLDMLNAGLAKTSRTVFERTVQAGESELKTVRAEVKFLADELDRLDAQGGRGRFSDDGREKQARLNALAEKQVELEKQVGAARANSAQVGTESLDKYIEKFATADQKLVRSREEAVKGFAEVIRQTSLDGVFDSTNAAHVSALRQLKAAQLELDKKQPKPKEAKATREDDLGDFLKDVDARVAPAEQAIARFRDIQLDAAVSGAELTKAERAFYDLINSPAWEGMGEPWKELARQQFEAANQAEILAQRRVRLNELMEDPSIKRQRADMLLLADAYEKGKFGIAGSEAAMKKYGETVNSVLGNVGEKSKETADIMEEFSKQAARNMQDAFADFLFDPFSKGLDGMLAGFGKMLQRMIAEAVAADLANRIMGKSGSGSTGLLELGLNAASAFVGFNSGTNFAPVVDRSFDGGGFTGSGMRTGGLDGKGGFPAILHPNETVIDHTRGQSVSSGNVVNLTINVPPGTPAEQRRAIGTGAREAVSALARAQRYA